MVKHLACAGPAAIAATKSKIGGTHPQRETLRSLGLHRIGDSVVKADRPEIRGMINRVPHLVNVTADETQGHVTAKETKQGTD